MMRIRQLVQIVMVAIFLSMLITSLYLLERRAHTEPHKPQPPKLGSEEDYHSNREVQDHSSDDFRIPPAPKPVRGRLGCPDALKQMSARPPQWGSVTRKRVAASLIVYKRLDTLEAMLASLYASDVVQNHDFTLFVWMNDLRSSAASFMTKFAERGNVVLLHNKEGTNEGIVIPRIQIMDAILKDTDPRPFEFVAEIHDDMTFAKHWFDELIRHDAPNVGILLPFIVNQYHKPIIREAEMEQIIADSNLAQDRVFDNTIQVHPWVLKLSAVQAVGYYDPAFAPAEMEDDDFYARMIEAGYLARAVQSSWAAHRGGTTRNVAVSLLQKHAAIFERKHNMPFAEWKSRNLMKCHPSLYLDF